MDVMGIVVSRSPTPVDPTNRAVMSIKICKGRFAVTLFNYKCQFYVKSLLLAFLLNLSVVSDCIYSADCIFEAVDYSE